MTTNLFAEAEKELKNLVSSEHYAEAYQLCMRILEADPENGRFYGYKNKIIQLIRTKNRLLIKQDLEKLTPLWKEGRYADILEHLKQLTSFLDDYPELKDLIAKAQKGYNQQFFLQNQKKYKDLFNITEDLLEKKQFQKAQETIKQLSELKMNLKNTKKLKKKLQKAWIEDQFANHQTLIKSTKYDDIILFLHELLAIDPDSKKVKKMLKKFQKARYRFQIFERQDFIYKSLEQIRILYQLHKYKLTVQASKEILEIDPKNAIAKSFYRKAKRRDENETTQKVINQMKQTQAKLQELNKEDTFALIRL